MPPPRADSPTKLKAHPLRAEFKSEAEERFISSLGNLDSLAEPSATGGRTPKQKAPEGHVATSAAAQKKLAGALRDESGERISAEQQQAVVHAMQALEEQQLLAFERRDIIAARIARAGRKLGEARERLHAVEKENAQIEQQAEGVKQEIARMRRAREQEVEAGGGVRVLGARRAEPSP